MNAKDFAKGLDALADRHKNDNITVFDTNWSAVCKEAANIILDLDDQLQSANNELAGWANWYFNHDTEVIDKVNADTEKEDKKLDINVPIFVNVSDKTTED